MATPFSLPLVLVTLGVVGIWRWGLWLARSLVGWLLYEPVEDDPPDVDVSIIAPVYQEDPEGFADALESWARNDPAEIVAVIDESDEACIEVFERFATENEAARLVVTDVPGKRAALRRGIREATRDVVALVDSDVRWRRRTKREFLRPFTDPEVGGVAPRQIVSEQETLAQRIYEATQQIRFATEVPTLSALAGKLSVVSGRTAVYRREAVLDAIENIERETFRHQMVISGEDKFLTRSINAAGWETRYQSTSVVDIGSARSLSTLFRQVVRWRRNSIRSDMRSLGSRWVYDRPALAYFMADRFVAPFAALLAPVYMLKLVLAGVGVVPAPQIAIGPWLLAGLLLVWWLVSRGIKLNPYLRRYGRVDVVPPYVGWTFAMIPVQLYGMVTATKQGWLTRGEDSRYGLPVRYNRTIGRLGIGFVALVLLVYVAVVVFVV